MGFISGPSTISEWFSNRKHRRSILLVSMLVMAISLVSNFIQIKIAYDTGLYHLAKVKWLSDYGFVPGLANLDGRFGFYSLLFMVASIIYKVFHKVELTLYINLVCQLMFSLFMIYRLNKSESPTEIFASMLALLTGLLLLPLTKSLYQDLTVFYLGSVVLVRFIEGEESSRPLSIYILLFFMVCMVSLKISTAFLVCLIPYIYLTRKLARPEKWEIVSLFLSAVLIFVFVIHNYYSSGWILYPSTFLDFFEVDWKVPAYLAQNMSMVVQYFAKSPGSLGHLIDVSNQGFLSWLPDFWAKISSSEKMLLLLGFTSSLLWNLLIIKYYGFSSRLYLSIGALLSLWFWFTGAPSVRFGLIYLFLPAIGLVRLLQNQFYAQLSDVNLFRYACLLLVMVFYANAANLESFLRYHRNTILSDLGINIPRTEVQTYRFKYGLETIFVPISGERQFWPDSLPVASRLMQDRSLPFINDVPRYLGSEFGQGFYTDSIRTIKAQPVDSLYVKTVD